jgi:regulator of sigma E protease
VTTLLAFLAAIAILVVVHEYGHFLAARLMGVKVLRFSVGFGKPLFIKQGKDGMEWALCALPLGGYVKMLDEREGPVPSHELDRAFNRAPVWRRFFIVSAGPIANFILAIFFYWALFVHGVPAIKPMIGEPVANSPAAVAGLRAGDEIVEVGHEAVNTYQELTLDLLEAVLSADAGGRIDIRLQSGHETVLSLSGINRSGAETDVMEKLGIRPYDPPIPPVFGTILNGSVAQRAGLAAGDRIESIDDTPVDTWQTLVRLVRAAPGKQLHIVIERDGRSMSVTLTPEVENVDGTRIGKIGAGPRLDEKWLAGLRTEVRYGPGRALIESVNKTLGLTGFTLEMMGRMVIGQVSWRNLSGPLTIADYAGQSAQMGWISFISFLALISVSLGVLNLLPIPLLDGGHLMYYSVEILRGRPLSEKAMELGSRIGIALIFIMMVLAFYNDLVRLTSGS